ncbi:MAG: hypothetical protein Q7R78_01340 [bacterium]|nr:hypothetical protein [bacterium]
MYKDAKDLIRERLKKDSRLSMDSVLLEGQPLISNLEITDLVAGALAMEIGPATANRFLVCNFPNNLEQAEIISRSDIKFNFVILKRTITQLRRNVGSDLASSARLEKRLNRFMSETRNAYRFLKGRYPRNFLVSDAKGADSLATDAETIIRQLCVDDTERSCVIGNLYRDGHPAHDLLLEVFRKNAHSRI